MLGWTLGFVAAYLLVGSLFAAKIYGNSLDSRRKTLPEIPLTREELSGLRSNAVALGLLGWPVAILLIIFIGWMLFWAWPVLEKYDAERRKKN